MLQARQGKGLSQAQVAEQLHVPMRVIAALEGGQWERLGAPVFIRGQLRSYARLLQLDAAPLLASVPVAPMDPVVMVSEGRSLPLRRPGQGLGRKLLYGVAVLALATPAVLLLRSYLQPAPAVASLDALPATDVAGPEAELALPVRVEAAGVQQSLPLVADAAATGLPSAPVTPAAAAATPTGEGAQLLLEFAGDSWIEIGGPQGQVVEKSLIPAGQQRRYRAEDVARVLLGNSTQVQASIDGRAIDLTAMGRSNVARFTVSSDGSVSPVVN
nr:helix-turn-helix domain-containing protein [Stenotrophomonas koreensis]